MHPHRVNQELQGAEQPIFFKQAGDRDRRKKNRTNKCHVPDRMGIVEGKRLHRESPDRGVKIESVVLTRRPTLRCTMRRRGTLMRFPSQAASKAIPARLHYATQSTACPRSNCAAWHRGSRKRPGLRLNPNIQVRGQRWSPYVFFGEKSGVVGVKSLWNHTVCAVTFV